MQLSIVSTVAKFRVDSQIINEAGLYHTIWQSRKPIAKKFKQWVYETVLPSIRKTGQYRIDELQKELEQERLISSKERKEKFQILHKYNSRLQKHRYYTLLLTLLSMVDPITYKFKNKCTDQGFKDFYFYK